LILFSLFLCIAFISFFFSWQEDQSALGKLTDKTIRSENLLGKIGASLSHFFIYDGFGIAAFIISFQIFLSGFYILIKKKFSKIIVSWNWNLFAMLWISVAFGFVNQKYALLSGVIGFEINEYVQTFTGKTGLAIILTFLLLTAFIEKFKQNKLKREAKKSEELNQTDNEKTTQIIEEVKSEKDNSNSIITEEKPKSEFELSLENLKPTISKHSDVKEKKDEITLKIEQEPTPVLKVEETVEDVNDVGIDIAIAREEEHSTENLSDIRIIKFQISNFQSFKTIQ